MPLNRIIHRLLIICLLFWQVDSIALLPDSGCNQLNDDIHEMQAMQIGDTAADLADDCENCENINCSSVCATANSIVADTSIAAIFYSANIVLITVRHTPRSGFHRSVYHPPTTISWCSEWILPFNDSTGSLIPASTIPLSQYRIRYIAVGIIPDDSTNMRKSDSIQSTKSAFIHSIWELLMR